MDKTEAKIRKYISRLPAKIMREIVFDVVKACHFDGDAWSEDNEHGPDLSCEVLDAISPLEIYRYMPETTSPEET